MGFFKQKVNLEDFCRDFYDNIIINPVDFMREYAENLKKGATSVDQKFVDVDLNKLKNELIFLQFELFALAFTHKFISGKIVIAQSIFTKNYLQQKNKNEIWNGMGYYNEYINLATLYWLSSLGKINLPFNQNMRKDLAEDNIKVAKDMAINIDEVVQFVNNRLWSENSWRQNFVIRELLQAICGKLNIQGLNKEAIIQLGSPIIALYEIVKKSLDDVKIIE